MTKKHALIMVACCMIPITVFVLIALFKVPVSGLVTAGLVLLCPISHLILMKFMMPAHDGHAEAQPRASVISAASRPLSHMDH